MLTFPIECDSMLHGFAGYFETVLYKDVMLSINPQTHSPGMFSWFPIFFPLQTPVYLKKVTICFLFFPFVVFVSAGTVVVLFSRFILHFILQGDLLETNFWRCVSRTHVWYEWCVSSPVAGPIHNPLGRSHQIGL